MSGTNGRLRAAAITAAVAASLFGAASAQADTYSTRFEAPKFSVGSPNGQDGWLLGNSAFDSRINANNGTQQAFGFGTQSMRISNSVTDGSFADQTYSAELGDEAGESQAVSGGQSGGVRQKKFDARFSFAAADPSTIPTETNPGDDDFPAVSVAADNGAGSRVAQVRIEDHPDGLHVFFTHVEGFGPTTDVTRPGDIDANFVVDDVATVTRNQAHTVRLEANFVNGESNDVVNVYVDGNLVKTGRSWEDYYRHDSEQAPAGNKVPTTDQLLFREAGMANPAAAGKGILIDDLRIESSGNPTGPQGPQGNTGGRGPAGASGTNGANGTNGQDGSAGGVLGTQESSPVLRFGINRGKTNGRNIAVRVRCKATSRCKGKVNLYARVGRKTVRVGRKSFSVAAGKLKTVKVKLSRKARTALRKKGKLKLSVRSSGAKAGSQKVSAKTGLTLRRKR